MGKKGIMKKRPVVDVRLVKCGTLLLRIPFDDVVFEHEIREKCCFSPECIGGGYYVEGELADPVVPGGMCCGACFHGRVQPARLSDPPPYSLSEQSHDKVLE